MFTELQDLTKIANYNLKELYLSLRCLILNSETI